MGVGDIILQQLGGREFTLLTGAKMFSTSGNDLSFRFGRGQGMRIKLNGRDLYDIDYFVIRGMEVNDKGQRTDVYAEDLKDVFEELTGLYVSFHPRKVAA